MALRSQPVLDGLWPPTEALSGQLAPAVFDSWLRPCRLLAVRATNLRIGAPNPFARDWSCNITSKPSKRAREKAWVATRKVSIVVDDAAATALDSPPHQRRQPRRPARRTVESTLIPSTTSSSDHRPIRPGRSQAVAELPSRAYNRCSSMAGVARQDALAPRDWSPTVRLFPARCRLSLVGALHHELIDAIPTTHGRLPARATGHRPPADR